MASKQPLVSIVIATYNYAKYLPIAIESALNQTYKNIEVIVVNDGSTDNTNEAIAPHLNDKRIRYIKQTNSGQTFAKNCGIKNSQGEYIAFLDADDYWMPDKLEKQLSLFSADSAVGVVFSLMKIVGPDNEKVETLKTLKPYKGWVTNHLIIDNFVPFSSSLVKRECLEKIGNFDETLRMSIDWDIWLKISINYKFDFVDEELIAYRIGHPNQMSKDQEKRQEQSDLILNTFIKNNPDMIFPKYYKKAMSYTYKNRGCYYQDKNKIKSIQYNIKSLIIDPFQPRLYLRIFKAVIPKIILRLIAKTINHIM